MPPTKKTFTDLMVLRTTDYMSPKAFIGTCQQILENRMKCHRAGDFIVQEEIPDPTADNPENVRVVEYQVCRHHAKFLQQQDIELLQKESTEIEAQSKTVQIGSIKEFSMLDKTAASLQPGDVVKIPVSILHQAMGIKAPEAPPSVQSENSTPDSASQNIQNSEAESSLKNNILENGSEVA